MRNFTICFVLVISLSCSKKESNCCDPQPVIMRNVSYGPDALQKMDVHLPTPRTVATTKVIVLIHGGAWNNGDKSDFEAYVDTLKRREPSYAIFNINYRLVTSPTNIFPTQEQDVKAAIDFILVKSGEYQVSQKLVLIGASAGGHLALLYAYKNNSPVKAIVDFFGPTELVSLHNNPPNPLVPVLLQAALGGTPTSVPLLYQQSSPVNFVTAQSPPTLVLQGGVDPVVPPTQSALLVAQLQAKGVAHQYVIYPTEGHSWIGANLTDSFNKIAAFLTIYVQ